MQIVAGDQQSAQVGTELAIPLVVKVLDTQGRAVSGQVVNFHVTSGGGNVFAGAAITNDSGGARERWTLGTSTADSQRVEARAVDNVTGAALTFAVFRAIALPGPAYAAAAVGIAQTGFLGAALPESLSVRVVDRYGNPVPGQLVRWSVFAGGGGLSSDSTVTGADGLTRVSWSLGPRLDTTQVARAVVGTVGSLQFTATPQLPSTATITKTAGDAQADTVGHTLRIAPSVTVKLADGRPVDGAAVAFAIDSGGGGATGTSAITDASGVATLGAWTLGTSAGTNKLHAAVTGLPSVVFAATSVAGAPAALGIVAGNAQSGMLGAALTDSVAVRVADRYGNPVAGKYVRWVVAAGNGAVSADSSVSGTVGVARVQWVLGTRLDTTHVLVATVGSLPSVRLTATPRIPGSATITKTAGDVQTDTVGHTLHLTPSVTVKLADGRPVVGATVTFAIDSGGGGATGTSAVTDASGIATVGSWTLGTAASTNTLRATTNGLPAVVFSATAVAGPAAQLAFTVQPSNALARSAINPPVQVTVEDAFGNRIRSSAADITVAITIGTGANGSVLGGTATMAAANGLATFADLSVDLAGTGYTLTASASSLRSSTSANYNILRVAIQVALGIFHTCALDDHNEAYCWGENDYNQLGDGTGREDSTPVAVAGNLRFSQIVTGLSSTCGLTAAGSAYCWGYNFFGGLGDSSVDIKQVPTAVRGGLTFVQLELGYGHTCGLTPEGLAYCWGYGQMGQLGNGASPFSQLKPVAVAGGLTFTQLSAGLNHTCGLTSDGSAYCWGDNRRSALGDGTTTSRVTPTRVSGGLSFTRLTAGNDHTCGRVGAADWYCWGTNDYGQLGDGTFTERSSPVAVGGGVMFLDVSTREDVSVGLTSDGKAYWWGYDRSGRFEDYHINDHPLPIPLVTALTFNLLRTGGNHICGLVPGVGVFCWGDNRNGELGDGTTSTRLSPAHVVGF